jgi:hypothetical protein
MKQKTFLLLVVVIGLVASLSVCAGAGASSAPTAPMDPITISDDLTSIDLCQAIPQEVIEAAMGMQLVEPTNSLYTPQYRRFEL